MFRAFPHPETASARVSLFVKNENDNVPVFKQKIYTFTAPLSTRRFTALGQVTAVDADGDAVIYRLTRQPGPFVVVPQTGEIILTENPQVQHGLDKKNSLGVRFLWDLHKFAGSESLPLDQNFVRVFSFCVTKKDDKDPDPLPDLWDQQH